MVFSVVVLFAGVVVTMIEYSSWRAGEKRFSLTGPIVIALAAAGLLSGRPDLQVGALLISLALVVAAVVIGEGRIWRRPETILLGSAALVMAAYYVPGVTPGIREVLPTGFALLLIGSVAMFLWRIATDLRNSKRA